MAFDVKKFISLSKKIVGAGLNYKSAVAEKKLKIPSEPIVFLKATTSYIGEGQLIQLPQKFEVHHEVELGVVIGRCCKNVEPNNVKDYIGGYCVALDLTAVNVLKKARASGNPWTIGKCFDTSCPVSRILTPDLLPSPEDTRLWCEVNGSPRQNCSVCDMIFPPDKLISYISKYITLEPYDLILTGTPGGTGEIKHGDHIVIGIGDILKAQFYVSNC